MPDASSVPSRREQTAWRCLAALAVAMVLIVAWHVGQRLGYPFELEWMEGAMVDHASRVRAGLDLFVPPGPEHVQFLYTPLFFQLGAALAVVTGDGFLPLRLVSVLATVLSAAIVHGWVRRETGQRIAGVVAAGLFVAGYGYLHSWYDLARNDTLVLAALLATAALLRHGGRHAVWWAAATALLAFLAKQTALMWLPAIGVGALLWDWRRGLVFVAAAAAAIVGTVLVYDALTDGWFSFFVFEMPRSHGRQGDRVLGYFTDDLVPMLPLAAGAVALCAVHWRSGRRRQAAFLAAFGGGGLLTSYLSRLHAGGYDNVLVFVFAAGCVLAPALAVAVGPRWRGWSLALLGLQFVLLAWDPRSLWMDRPALPLDGRRFLPTAAHRAASEELVRFLASREGDVFVPFHGHVAALAGKPRTAHAQAMGDLVQLLRGHEVAVLMHPEASSMFSPRALQALTGFFAQCNAALTDRRFATVVLDVPNGVLVEQAFAAGLVGYERRAESPIREPRALQPAVGMITHSPYVLQPRR
jgi:hypothetical protein